MIDTFVAAAQTIDVEAATRAYLDTLSGSARARSNAYFEGKYWLLVWNAAVGVLIAGQCSASAGRRRGGTGRSG